MKLSDYQVQIDRWAERALQAGVTLSDGKPLPLTFWKSFLGLKRRVHQEMYNGTRRSVDDNIPGYIVASIGFVNLLSNEVFIQKVRDTVPVFEADKVS
ncbi:hypothetical protein OCF84_21575 (plasmid) [Shewanella xiamenensis]|uniref:Uncharacterized protein n=1 Tax=Shewanella xiamenensis TaxID=332186 RepID=A0ABT6UDI8_9GAMM|nr:hypothetical protein [Shewanella xiamenensis]MDI5832532.1 hypothetical protein [Shewanella xiamenensis]WHF57850.1 hypothetical protein OCF84_21575 [Shewanella xiamenensis]